MSSRFLTVPLCLVVVAAALGAGWTASRGAEQRPAIAAALSALPASTETVDYTDWTRVTGSLDAAGLDGLTTRSVLAPIDAEMRDLLGWSVRDLEWEAYGRTDAGGVTAIGLGEVSVDTAERSFEAIGAPVDGDRGAYRLAADPAPSAEFSSAFAWVRVVRGRDLVLAAPDRASLDDATAAITGDTASLLGVRPVAALASRLRGSTSVLLQQRQFLCASSAIGPGDEATRSQLSAALASSPGSRRLADPTWGARGLFDADPQRIVFATAFGSDAAARDQSRVRVALADGAFVGRSGQVSDSLRDLRSAESDGVVSLDFALTPEGEQFMTDTGPVVFAGCAP